MEMSQNICRLCGTISSTQNSSEASQEKNTWIPLNQAIKNFQDGGTVSSVIKNCIPGVIMLNLPEDKTTQILCEQCFTDLVRLVDFFNRIREGQKVLSEKLNFTPKRRGRPKKDFTKPEKQSEKSESSPEICSSAICIGKRASRLPVRFATDGENNVKLSNIKESADSQALYNDIKKNLNESKDDEETLGTNDTVHIISKSKVNYAKFLPEKRGKRVSSKSKKPLDFKCDSCDKVYHNYSSLVYHKNATHKKPKNFECDVCKKRFSHKSILTNHKFTHSSEKSFKCELCEASFQTRNQLATHVRKFHDPVSEKPFVCD